jgi:DNA-binding CsgD family transcriptional regulator
LTIWTTGYGKGDSETLLDTKTFVLYNPCMSIWRKLLYWLGVRDDPGPRFYELEVGLQKSVSTLAAYEGRPEKAVVADLLAAGLTQYKDQDVFWHYWETLSPREREITAYSCLGYTNKQIAAHLGISPETVKTHVRNVLYKFDVHSKAKLRVMLASWDFSNWK